MEITQKTYLGKKYEYIYEDGVIKSDYYKDQLIKYLPNVMFELLKVKDKIKVLDMATGHGYTLVILSDFYNKHIDKIVAYDINPKAVKLARTNVQRNNCPLHKIDFRIGSLYEPLMEDEKFDLIVSALPPVPINSDELEKMPEDIKVHHWITSTAGTTGRDLLDGMIKNAFKYLNPNGVVITAQADFQNAVQHTLDIMRKNSLNGERIGIPKSIKIKDTKLTWNRKEHISNLGYNFTEDKNGDEQFFVEVYRGIYL